MLITNHIFGVGVMDNLTDLFEGQYPIPDGISYNSYLIIDDRIVVMDSVDSRFSDEWISNIRARLGERAPDYLIVQHMEPDHSSSICHFLDAFPTARLVSSSKAYTMMRNFFGRDLTDGSIVVSDGDTLSLGTHELRFIAAPMVHWPEVIMTYDTTDKVLFSADAFGKFGMADGDEWADEARRYYIGIVGKYGAQVQSLLKKVSGLDISVICSLHGPVLRDDLSRYIDLYSVWSSYAPEEQGVFIGYASVYGNTRSAAHCLADELRSLGAKVSVYDLSRCDMTAAVADAFRYSDTVLASSTYNADIFPPMRDFINRLTERGFSARRVSFIENGSWAPMAEKVMRGMLEKSKNLTYTENSVKILSAVNEANREQIKALAREICK
ncbi:MAG: FprA family A-type flavoprotein [Clostridia bacterium]|nr:FprA family A-type flavoprotein [Clostridia bacterium]